MCTGIPTTPWGQCGWRIETPFPSQCKVYEGQAEGGSKDIGRGPGGNYAGSKHLLESSREQLLAALVKSDQMNAISGNGLSPSTTGAAAALHGEGDKPPLLHGNTATVPIQPACSSTSLDCAVLLSYFHHPPQSFRSG